jgi:hypothetical protein
MAPKVNAERRRRATAEARKGGYVDANFDFIPDKDQLSREELAAQYQSAVGIIYTVPELQGIFEQALNEGWTPVRLNAAVQNSGWFRDNDQFARVAWAKEQMGGADWQASLSDAQRVVMDSARQLGATINEQEAAALARRYIYEGWSESTRSGLLAKALSEKISFLPDSRGVTRMTGASGNLADNLRSLASANGMNFSNNWYESAARSVASGLSNADDWERDIREQAASYWPVYGEKIRQGMNVYDLASPYIQSMAQEFEIDPNQITLNDPYIRSALTGMSPNGDFQPTGLWEFQKKLRNDPRWENTSKAQNEITGVTGRVMQMFGLMGG